MKYLIIPIAIASVVFLPNPYWIPFYVLAILLMIRKIVSHW